MSAYLGKPLREIRATLVLLDWYRAFIASPFEEAQDPIRRNGNRITREQAARDLRRLVHAAIDRKAGRPGDFYEDPKDWPVRRLASAVNTPRLIVRERAHMDVPKRIRRRLRHRFSEEV